MSVGNFEVLKTLDEGFRESKITQLGAFLKDQRELNARLRKCSFDAKLSLNNAGNNAGNVGKAHRLRPLSARPSTAEAPQQANQNCSDHRSDSNRQNSRTQNSKKRRPSTACGVSSLSEEFDLSGDESVFDTLSITSLQSGTPSIGDLGDIEELDETPSLEDGCKSIHADLIRHFSPSSLSHATKAVSTESNYKNKTSPSTGLHMKPTGGDMRGLSAAATTYVLGGKAKQNRESRRKSATNVKHSRFSSLQSPSVESNSISGITTIACSASLYKKIRHHSAPASRNDEIVSRMNQQSEESIGLVCLPPLATAEKSTKPWRVSSMEHTISPNSPSEFIMTRQLLKVESIL